MTITEYKPKQTPPLELVKMLRTNYRESKNFDFFFSDFTKAFSFCVNNENVLFHPFAGYKDKDMQAHIALIIDNRLPTGEAFFGFIEIPEEVRVFKEMWEILTKKAQGLGISTLKGPVNGSIWHQYRCIKETDGSPFFKAELPSMPYYYKFLSSNKPTLEVQYYSAYREKFDTVLQVSQQGFEKLTTLGFVIKEMKIITTKELGAVAALSKTVFSNNWGYTELTGSEFLQLYSSEKVSKHLNKLYLLYRDKDIIGYCSTVKEDNSTIICKTICVLPNYQGLGLGNALAYKVHLDAKKEGIGKIIYALIREGNQVKNFPKDDTVIFRRYATFEFKI